MIYVLRARSTNFYNIGYTSKDDARARAAELQTGNPRKKLEELMTIRDPLYREIASIIIDTDGMRVRDVVKIIMQRLA